MWCSSSPTAEDGMNAQKVEHRTPPGRHRASERSAQQPIARGWIAGIGSTAAEHRRLVLLVSGVLCVLAIVFGSAPLESLAGGGYTPADAESARVQDELTARFAGGSANLFIVATSDAGVDSPDAVRAATELRSTLLDSGRVDWVRSAWSSQDPALRSTDGRSGLFLVRLSGNEDQAQRTAADLVPVWKDQTALLQLAVTGEAQVNAEVNTASEDDLVKAEYIGAPIVLLLLLLVFRTPLAALLPLVVGAVSVALTLGVLAILVQVTEVSQFALNVTTALGFGLAVDYSLFVITRFREESAKGRPLTDAIVASTALAGRTVMFSAVTVATSLAALLVFPLYFLRSVAYAAIPVVLIAAAASVVVLPALLRIVGRNIDRWDLLGRFVGKPQASSPRWYWLARGVMRRPWLFGLPVTALLILLAAPFLGVQFGLTDYRVMSSDAPAYQAAESISRGFPGADANSVQLVLVGADPSAVDDYARQLSTRGGVDVVQAPGASYAKGAPIGPAEVDRVKDGAAWVTAVLDQDPHSTAAQTLVQQIRDDGGPGQLSVGGDTAIMVDTKAVLAQRLPLAMVFILFATMTLLFLFTGSVIIPIKAIVMNMLSLTASFGVAVYIFQDGNLRWLVGDFTPTGYLEITVPVLMFCIAFGLSMDYEVFLISRIREEYSHRPDNDEAVATGVSQTGRLITAAAAIVAAVLVVLATSSLSVLKLLGVGLAVAVIVDSVLVRGVLVPAFMKLMGRANWWAPAPLRRLDDRIGLRD
jgi:RND superfamily putative drug exporter